MNLNTLKSHITRYLVQYHDLITSLFIVFIFLPPPHPSPFVSFIKLLNSTIFFFFLSPFSHNWSLANLSPSFLIFRLDGSLLPPLLPYHRYITSLLITSSFSPCDSHSSTSRTRLLPFHNVSFRWYIEDRPLLRLQSIPYRTKISMISLCAGVVIGLHSKDFLPGICACRFDRSPPSFSFEKIPVKMQ